MHRLGVIHNPKATKNRNPQARGVFNAPWRELDPDTLYAEAGEPEDLVEILREFARREVGVLAVEGGDGTVREVMTALPKVFDGSHPALAILPSGKTNVIAADVNDSAYVRPSLYRLAQDAREGRIEERLQRRTSLKVSWDDDAREPVLGMFMGAAAFARGTALAQDMHAHGARQSALALTLVTALLQAKSGPESDAWVAGAPMTVALDGQPTRRSDRFLFLATTLQKLILNVWPFWNERGDTGAIHWLDVDAPAQRIGSALVPVLRGKPAPWMEAAGYRSGVADAVALTLDRDFVLDGELFSPGPGGTVSLTAGPPIAFVGR